MDLGLEGKRVLVTGGTRSIGRAIVDAFLGEGAVVGFCVRNPMGRMGTPQEVAAAVVFLAGTQASFVGGVNFVVDGALTSRVQY